MFYLLFEKFLNKEERKKYYRDKAASVPASERVISIDDHCNFKTNHSDKIHCPTDVKVKDNSHISIGQWDSSIKKYKIIHSEIKLLVSIFVLLNNLSFFFVKRWLKNFKEI
jgi:hypothetical protein